MCMHAIAREEAVAPAGNLRGHAAYWRSVCTSTLVLSGIVSGVQLFWKHAPPPVHAVQNHKSALEQHKFIDAKIAHTHAAGCIRVSHTKPIVVLPLSVVPKKNGKLRLILDLSWLNQYLVIPSFTYESAWQLRHLARHEDLVFSIDLADGYWQVPMHPSAYPYLGFEWRGTYYEFTVLPFGLATAPLVFTKVTRQIVV